MCCVSVSVTPPRTACGSPTLPLQGRVATRDSLAREQRAPTSIIAFHLSLSVDNPARASTTAMIQNRITICGSIHPHFEQLGWTEPQIVIRFWIIAVVLALAGLSTLKLR